MSVLPDETREAFYTPAKCEMLLRQLPYLLDRSAPRHDERGSMRKHSTPSGWREEQMSKRADIEAAFDRLPDFTRRVIYLVCIGDKTYRDVASIVDSSHTTVGHHKVEGLRLMAWYLGWRDASVGWGERTPALRKTRAS